MSETKAALHMAIIEIAPPDPDAVKARLDVQAKSWARPDALEHREPVAEVEIAYDALNCIHYLQGEIASLRAQLETVRGALRADDERLRAAGMRSDCYFGCDTPDAMAEKIAALTAQLDEARRKAIEECARIADEYEGEGLDGKFMREGGDGVRTKLDIAKSIRALLSEGKA